MEPDELLTLQSTSAYSAAIADALAGLHEGASVRVALRGTAGDIVRHAEGWEIGLLLLWPRNCEALPPDPEAVLWYHTSAWIPEDGFTSYKGSRGLASTTPAIQAAHLAGLCGACAVSFDCDIPDEVRQAIEAGGLKVSGAKVQLSVDTDAAD